MFRRCSEAATQTEKIPMGSGEGELGEESRRRRMEGKRKEMSGGKEERESKRKEGNKRVREIFGGEERREKGR